MKKTYDFLIVGAGLFGAVFAREATDAGHRCLVVDKRPHTGGNIYCREENGILVHEYGAHIFHTSNREVWDYANRYAEFNRFTNSPLAYYKGKLYNLPFNMNTFYQLWGTKTPREAWEKIEGQRKEYAETTPSNLEEQALKLCGKDIYEKLIKGYTEKQWGRPATELPPFIIRRVPLRFTFDNNYFDDLYQGIPHGGYNVLINNLLEGIEVRLSTDFLHHREELEKAARRILYTGCIDEYYEYRFGKLEYRSLRFEHRSLQQTDFQGNAVINYCEGGIPYTRIIEHKHFDGGIHPDTVITYEYPAKFSAGMEPYYPVNDDRNIALLEQYRQLAKTDEKVIFGGRLGSYTYADMDDTMEAALDLCKKILTYNS